MRKQNFIAAEYGVLILLCCVFFFAGSCRSGPAASAGVPVEIKSYPYCYPLKQGPGNRYLIDQDNTPFFWSGDAAWSLLAQVSLKDADLYLDNRSRIGFTVIMVNLIEHKFCTNPPANIYGELPFTGKVFTSPNEKYFAHADSVIISAARHHIAVLLAPLYLGYDCKDEGWCAEVNNASPGDLRSWGRFLGNRYKKFKNIIWLIGGDTDPSRVKGKVLEMIKGICENDSLSLFSAHNQPGSMAISPWIGERWLSLNNVYSYDSVLYTNYRIAYDHLPVTPFFLIESVYENEHGSKPGQLRYQAYEAVLSGAMGHIFGNCPIWHFGSVAKWCNNTNWKNELNNSGSVSMDYLQRLLRSRPWQSLIPDFENKIIISGYGRCGTKDHVAVARTHDRNTIIAYLPTRRPVEADMTSIRGSEAKCWWYDPSNGKASEIGTYPASGIHRFIPVSAGDMVLVIDNDSIQFQAPGSVPMIAADRVKFSLK